MQVTLKQLQELLDLSRSGLYVAVLRRYGIQPTRTLDNKPVYEARITDESVILRADGKTVVVPRAKEERKRQGYAKQRQTLAKKKESRQHTN